MERLHYDPEKPGSPETVIRICYGDTPIDLHWGNTVLRRYDLGDGRYDHITVGEDPADRFDLFLDEIDHYGLGEELEHFRYPLIRLAGVEDVVRNARHIYEETLFSQDLEHVRGVDDLLT